MIGSPGCCCKELITLTVRVPCVLAPAGFFDGTVATCIDSTGAKVTCAMTAVLETIAAPPSCAGTFAASAECSVPVIRGSVKVTITSPNFPTIDTTIQVAQGSKGFSFTAPLPPGYGSGTPLTADCSCTEFFISQGLDVCSPCFGQTPLGLPTHLTANDGIGEFVLTNGQATISRTTDLYYSAVGEICISGFQPTVCRGSPTSAEIELLVAFGCNAGTFALTISAPTCGSCTFAPNSVGAGFYAGATPVNGISEIIGNYWSCDPFFVSLTVTFYAPFDSIYGVSRTITISQ